MSILCCDARCSSEIAAKAKWNKLAALVLLIVGALQKKTATDA